MSMAVAHPRFLWWAQPTPQKTWSGRTSGVFSINLVRHQNLPLRIRRLLIAIALGYLMAQVALTAWLLHAVHDSTTHWRHVQAQLRGQVPSVAAAQALRQEVAVLRERANGDLSQIQAMITLQRPRFPVAGKLAALTHTLPARTWITSLAGARESRTITIQAAYLIDPAQPYNLPTKGWVEALKGDPAFRQGLKRLDLKASARKMQGTAELFSFELVAEWQPVTGQGGS